MGIVVEMNQGGASARSAADMGAPDLSDEKRKSLEQLLGCYDEALQLEQIAKLAFTDPLAARDALRLFGGNSGFEFLETAISAFIMRSIADSRYREEHVRKEFYDNLGAYIPGATKAAVPLFKKNIPDGFIAVDGETAPVEIKRYAFDEKALVQILRYMTAYRCDLGFAVAPKLACKLPANVRFVKVLPPDQEARQ
jgi:hypothetical protein